ncbi:MAG: LLM class flavin-dependent oxidoreductase, partial [Rhodospirillaceae bacterium]
AKRVGRPLEGLNLCQALGTGEPVDWDGRWTLSGAVVGPTPHRPGGPPIWGGGGVEGALKRAGRYHDGWMPSGPADSAVYAERWAQIAEHARAAGRDPADIVGSMYLTLAVGDDAQEADVRINTYLETYYNIPAPKLRAVQATFAGTRAQALDWLGGFVDAGVRHFVLRYVGPHEANIELAAEMRAALNA